MILDYIKKYKKLIFFNKVEKIFLKSNINLKKQSKKKSKIKKKVVLLQMPMNYYFLLMSKTMVFENHINDKIYGTWCYYVRPLPKKFLVLEIIHYIFNSIIYSFLLKKKWRKLYKKNNITSFKDFSNLGLKSIYYSIKNIFKIFPNIKNNSDILKIKIKNIYIGDLVYDTYIRYRGVPTVDKNDFFLKYIIFKSFLLIYNLENFLKKNKINFYYTSYSSYINHGLIVRYFLKKKINVITLPNNYGNNYSNLITNRHPYARKNYEKLLSKFEKLKNKNKKIFFAKKQFLNRFQGKSELLTKYLKNRPNYQIDLKEKSNFNYEGIVYLHDFYDAPHEGGMKLFSDYFEWFDFLSFVIKKHNLNFAFKFHPNSKPESKKFNEFLKNNYKSSRFLEEDISNHMLLRSKNLKVGISAHGSALQELLYFKKIPIYLASNLISPLKIHKIPKTKKEYENLILNYKKIKITNSQINKMFKLYYMAVSDQSYFKCEIAKKIKLKDMNINKIQDFSKYSNKIETELKLIY
jgi:hypothetical protein